jgi:hypothetical protein
VLRGVLWRGVRGRSVPRRRPETPEMRRDDTRIRRM